MKIEWLQCPSAPIIVYIRSLQAQPTVFCHVAADSALLGRKRAGGV